MGVKERLIQFIESKRLTVKAFQQVVGVSGAYVANISQNIGAATLDRISKAYPELNIDWLLEGKGEMLKEKEKDTLTGKTIFILPVSAQAGRLTGFTTSVYAQDCERMISPIDDAEFALTVTGDSMSPEYTNGSRIFVKRINEKAFIDWGRTFVLDTCNGIVIKNIYPGGTEECVRCVSVNDKYPDFEVQFSDIYGWYRVLGNLALK